MIAARSIASSYWTMVLVTKLDKFVESFDMALTFTAIEPGPFVHSDPKSSLGDGAEDVHFHDRQLLSKVKGIEV
jgi:hypothetical protein